MLNTSWRYAWKIVFKLIQFSLLSSFSLSHAPLLSSTHIIHMIFYDLTSSTIYPSFKFNPFRVCLLLYFNSIFARNIKENFYLWDFNLISRGILLRVKVESDSTLFIPKSIKMLTSIHVFMCVCGFDEIIAMFCCSH